MSYNSEAKLRKNYFTEIMKKAREKYFDGKNNQ